MKRHAEKVLQAWFEGTRRKPLVLRGARQVGKSTLVRQFAAERGLALNEINLERHLSLRRAFASLDVKRICAELEVIVGRAVNASGSLLFLDEIQAVPEALAALRYFHEDMPELPVVAAGSLLEFTLANHAFSMPVGRIEYLHLGPMTFREFAEAASPEMVRYLDYFAVGRELPESAHSVLMGLVRKYCFTGGMPEAVLAFVQTGTLQESVAVHRRILQTYEDDFAKYARSRDLALMQEIFRRIPAMVGQKIKYVNFSREVLSRNVKEALDLLMKARVCSAVTASSCTGIPLAAGCGVSPSRKLVFLDVGLMNHACGVDWSMLERMDGLRLINEGVIAEQFVAQHLLFHDEGLEAPSLCYWMREARQSNAEVDYVVSSGTEVIPVEVKAGKSGSLRSLRQFVIERRPLRAIRFDANPASRQTVEIADADPISCELISLPLYAVGEWRATLARSGGI